MQMVVELKFQNKYLKSHFQDLKDVYADSAGSSVQAKEVDNDSKELKDKIEALNEELVIERQTRGAAEATLEHLRAEYIEADAKSQELEAKLAEAEEIRSKEGQEVAALEFSHLNHSLSHRPVSVKPYISKADISKTSSTGGKLHILKPSCERNGITPTLKESLSLTSGSKVPNSPLTGNHMALKSVAAISHDEREEL
ncbi:hypothetical protein Tco_0300150 [Tanacetum coccineum]